MPTEHEEQQALFDWAEWQVNIEPDLALMYAIPNGQYRPGQRPEAGLKSGVPDICLPIPKGKYHGLYLELKVNGNKPTGNQLDWLDRLNRVGYFTAVADGFDEAVNLITAYMGEVVE